MNGYFITGTDTGVGKTRVSVAIIAKLVKQGLSVAAMKPVASGCQRTDGQLENPDAQELLKAINIEQTYTETNPYALIEPIAPHLAAANMHIDIDTAVILQHFRQLSGRSDAIVTEGVGGWMVPLNGPQLLGDLARQMDLPVVLVVALRLGCINHALLTIQAIGHSGCRLAGWVANQPSPDIERAEQLERALEERIHVPKLGSLPFFVDSGNFNSSDYIALPD